MKPFHRKLFCGEKKKKKWKNECNLSLDTNMNVIPLNYHPSMNIFLTSNASFCCHC